MKTNHYFDRSDSTGAEDFSIPTNDVLDKSKLQPELDNLFVMVRNIVEPSECIAMDNEKGEQL